MDLEGLTLSEISQTEKKKILMISLVRGVLKKKKDLNSWQKRSDLWLPEVEGELKGGDQKVKTSHCKRNMY